MRAVRERILILLAATALGALAGCAGGPTAEENFRNIMSLKVGETIYPVHSEPKAIRRIDADTQEFEFECCARGCKYYYYVDWTTRIVRSWRWEGPCRIVP
jgi:hypothetical protein